MRRWLIGLLLLLPWLAWADSPWRLELRTYEGTEYTCHLAQGRCWYEFAGHKIGQRTLKPREIQLVESALREQRFQALPTEMRNDRIDSTDTLRLWKSGKSKAVTATNPYQGPLDSQYKRFRALVTVIRRVSPIPVAEMERLRQKATQ